MGFLLLGGTSCYKDDVDPDALTDNPFDADYEGPPIFSFIEVTEETITPPPPAPTVTAQWVKFRVNSSLFLEPTSYQVRVYDLTTGSVELIGQIPVGNDVLQYQRDTLQLGTGEVCLELRLSNNLSYGHAETICGPL